MIQGGWTIRRNTNFIVCTHPAGERFKSFCSAVDAYPALLGRSEAPPPMDGSQLLREIALEPRVRANIFGFLTTATTPTTSTGAPSNFPGAPQPWEECQLRPKSRAVALSTLGGLGSEVQVVYASCGVLYGNYGLYKSKDSLYLTHGLENGRYWPGARVEGDLLQRSDASELYDLGRAARRAYADLKATRGAYSKTPTASLADAVDLLRAKWCTLAEPMLATRDDAWSLASYCFMSSEAGRWAPMASMCSWDGDGNFGLATEYESQTGAPFANPYAYKFAKRTNCASAFSPEIAGARCLEDRTIPSDLRRLYLKLDPHSPGARIFMHALSYAPPTPETFGVCVCLQAHQIAKALAVMDYGAAATKEGMSDLNVAMGVAETHTGDPLKLSRALSHYIFQISSCSRDCFYRDVKLKKQLPGAVTGDFSTGPCYVVDKGKTIYLPPVVVGAPPRAYEVLSNIGLYTLTVVFIDNPNGGKGLVGVPSDAEFEVTTDGLFGVPVRSCWPHTPILGEIISREWFVRGPADGVGAVVLRHAVAGWGGTQLLVATNGTAVVVVSTNMSAELLWYDGRYPEHLLAPEWLRRCLPDFGSPGWGSTFAPEFHKDGRKNVSPSAVRNHQKLIGLALEASGAVKQLAPDWPRPKKGSAYTAASLIGRAYCTVVENDFQAAEVGSTGRGSGGPRDEVFAAKLSALKEFLDPKPAVEKKKKKKKKQRRK